MDWVSALTLFDDDRMRVGIIVVFLVAYAILVAVPFVPGVEIGLSLMMMEGPWSAPLIYFSTGAGLSMAFAAGEWISYTRLHRIFEDLRLKQACRLLKAVEPLSHAERLDALHSNSPAWLRPLATRYRYILLAVLINLPGNAVIGGGGGILSASGLSRLFQPTHTIVTIFIAVAPVPVAVWVFRIDLGNFLD